MTLIEPEYGPWGPVPSPKVGLLLSFFLDFSLNPKLDTLIGYTNPTFVPEGPPIGPNPVLNLTLIEPEFGPWGPDPPPKCGFNLGLFLKF